MSSGARSSGVPSVITFIFLYLGFGQPFAVFIFYGFIKNIPRELEEAAKIDGANCRVF